MSMTDLEKRNIAILVVAVIVASVGFSFLIRSQNLSRIPVAASTPLVETPTIVPATVSNATNSDVFDLVPKP